MSREVTQFLWSHGVVMTHSTPYHPMGNGQCERENGSIWKGVRLALHSRNLPITQWETVLDTVLHSLRSLLCTATNETPHERLFAFPRKSPSGYSLPTWLSTPGPVLLRKFVRQSKSDDLVEPVDLVSATPHYARVRYPNGRESTVSTRDLAPTGVEASPRDSSSPGEPEGLAPMEERDENAIQPQADPTASLPPPTENSNDPPSHTPAVPSPEANLPRRSVRVKRAPERLDL